MIIKSMSRKQNIGRTIRYLFKEETKLSSREHKQIVIRRNIRTRKLENIIKEFEENEALRKYKRKDQVKLYHTVISFHKKDAKHVSEKMLRDITKQYMKLQGNNMYVAAAHYDREHTHIHIAMSGSGYLNGKANRLSRKEFSELKVALQTYQKTKYPELKHSQPRHGKGVFQKDNPSLINVRETQKQTLLKCLSNAEKKSTSMDEFLTAIKEAGHEPYYRAGKLTGIRYEGNQKFRLSRLGYDKAKLEELSQRLTDEKEKLEELGELRSGSSGSRSRSEERSLSVAEEKEQDVEPDTENDQEEDYSR